MHCTHGSGTTIMFRMVHCAAYGCHHRSERGEKARECPLSPIKQRDGFSTLGQKRTTTYLVVPKRFVMNTLKNVVLRLKPHET